MRAISSFSREAGTSTFCWRARIALRRRVRKSATGSVKFIVVLSCPFAPPAGEPVGNYFAGHYQLFRSRRNASQRRCLPGTLEHPGNLAFKRELPEAQAADSEAAKE